MKLRSQRFISPITLWLGNRGLIRSGSQTRAGDPQGQSVHKVGREALANFISPITLWLGNPGLIRSGSQTRTGGPQAGLSVHKVGREALAIFISPITLWLGNRMLSPPKSQGCERRAWVDLLVKPSFARRLLNLFHRLHFGWATGCFPLPRVRAASGGPGLISR